jgi:transposase
VLAKSVPLSIRRGLNSGDVPQTQWERLQPLLPPPKPQTGRPAVAHRRILNGRLWSLRPGAPWRERPERYGPWRTVASRFERWQRAGIWSRLGAAGQTPAVAEGQLNGALHDSDGPMIRAPHHAAGAKQGPPRPQPEAGAGAGSAPKSTGGPTGAAN